MGRSNSVGRKIPMAIHTQTRVKLYSTQQRLGYMPVHKHGSHRRPHRKFNAKMALNDNYG